MEIKAIIDEFQMQALSGCMAAWELWEHALLPSLLSGAGTWLGDIEEAVEVWDKTQNFFLSPDSRSSGIMYKGGSKEQNKDYSNEMEDLGIKMPPSETVTAARGYCPSQESLSGSL